MMPVLVFGATGTLGGSILASLIESGYEAIGVSRTKRDSSFVSLEDSQWISNLEANSKKYSVVFAQGENLNDSVDSPAELRHVLEANVVFPVEQLSQLLKSNLVGEGSSVVILSSIWQNLSRPNKLSYSISKSAIRGLVGSLVTDLSPRGIRVNAVLPGVVDSPMTRQVIPEETLVRVIGETPMGSLVTEKEVARVAIWLVSEQSKGVTGEFVKVDNGWSDVRLYP